MSVFGAYHVVNHRVSPWTSTLIARPSAHVNGPAGSGTVGWMSARMEECMNPFIAILQQIRLESALIEVYKNPPGVHLDRDRHHAELPLSHMCF